MSLKRLATPMLLASAFVIAPAAGQMQNPLSPAETARFAPVPFGPGEYMSYRISLGILGNVGSGSIEIGALDTLFSRPVYKLRMQITGKKLMAEVNDDYQSWVDAERFVSLRFHQNIHEINYKRLRTLDFDIPAGKWRRLEKEETGPLASREPLDDLSFLYFVRSLPLEVGKEYTFNRYFKQEGNPVRIKVLRRETITVPAGKFNTIVVQPIIQTTGLFGEGGRAEVFFTDDEARIPVQIKSRVKLIGSLNMELQSYTPGTRLAPPAPRASR